MLGETAAELDVFGQRGVDPARGRDDDPLDLFSFGVGRWRGAGELGEAQEEFRDRRDIGLIEGEAKPFMERARDRRRGVRDGVIDQRSQLSALQLRATVSTKPSRDDREIHTGRGGHRRARLEVGELLTPFASSVSAGAASRTSARSALRMSISLPRTASPMPGVR